MSCSLPASPGIWRTASGSPTPRTVEPASGRRSREAEPVEEVTFNRRLELLLRTAHDPGEVFAALSAHYTVLAEPVTSERWTYLDTADWRLHRAGMSLRDRRRGGSGELVLTTAGGEHLTAPSRARAWPRRLDGVAASPVRDRLAPAVGVRALLPMAAIDSRSVRLRLLDDEQKTRVWVDVDQQRLADASRAPLPLRVLFTPLRGYERDGLRCADLLAGAMAIAPDGADPVSAALTAAGRRPGLAGFVAPVIEPSAPSYHSIAAVLTGLLDVVEANRAGAVDDIDVEFLHEIRTSVRATRSILSLTGDQLPSPHWQHFAEEFRWLGRLTAPLRDLDVFLLALRGLGGVDVSDLTSLDPLRRHFQRHRRPALRTVRDGLTSQRATILIERWRGVLDGIAGSDVPGRPTEALVAERAEAAYARIRKAAREVTAATPPEELHRFRGRCKRMRYLLDVFGGAYDPGSRRLVLLQLKKLQDRLGDIQDGDVQTRGVREAAATLAVRGGPVDTLLAIGAMIDRLASRDREARRDLDARLARFCGPEIRRNVAALRVDSAPRTT